MTTYETKIWGQKYAIRADFAQASDNIEVYSDNSGEWQSCGMQVADFCHNWRDAFRWFLTDDEDEDKIDMHEVDAAINNSIILD